MGMGRWLGLLRFRKSPVVKHPLEEPLWALVEELKDVRRERREHHEQMVEIARDQYQLLERALDQYVAVGENQTSSLDERLFKKEEQWEPLNEDDLFKGFGQ